MRPAVFADEITAIGNALGLEGRFMCEFGFNQIMAILKPEPEMETVTVERWGAIWPDGRTSDGLWDTVEIAAAMTDGPNGAGVPIKLTGTITRPKPAPVERSVSVSGVVISKSGGFDTWPKDPAFGSTNLFQRTAAEGKTVTLTATWSEPPHE
jgi:hypothetical protein